MCFGRRFFCALFSEYGELQEVDIFCLNLFFPGDILKNLCISLGKENYRKTPDIHTVSRYIKDLLTFLTLLTTCNKSESLYLTYLDEIDFHS